MSDDRRLAVLRAIVQDYVQTSEPVGSKALLERHQLGVSAATVRNDMAALEEAGLIVAPHTSAGRIPTDAGYRLFVDRLSTIKPMSSAERAAIARFLDTAVDLDDVVDRTVRLLSTLTRQVAVMQYPSISRSTVRHLELVPIGGARVMVVLILNTGRVEQRVVDAGVGLAFGSDAPVESCDPFVGIGAAVTRTRPDGTPQGGWQPQERLSVAEAVTAYTSGASAAFGPAWRGGALAPGYDADLVALDRDPFAEPVEAIRSTRVLTTVVGGLPRWSA